MIVWLLSQHPHPSTCLLFQLCSITVWTVVMFTAPSPSRVSAPPPHACQCPSLPLMRVSAPPSPSCVSVPLPLMRVSAPPSPSCVSVPLPLSCAQIRYIVGTLGMPTDYQLNYGTKTKRFMSCRRIPSGLHWELKVRTVLHTNTPREQVAVVGHTRGTGSCGWTH